MQPEELMKMKKTLEQKKSTRDQLLGARNALLDSLRNEGYNSIEEAEKALDEMDAVISRKEEQLELDVKKFKETFGELLI